MKKLSKLDMQIEDNIHEWKSVHDSKKRQTAETLVQQLATKSRKEAKFTARLNQTDLDGLKQLAAKKRIPYQTLLGHIIHSYVTGVLVDVSEIRKIFPKLKI